MVLNSKCWLSFKLYVKFKRFNKVKICCHIFTVLFNVVELTTKKYLLTIFEVPLILCVLVLILRIVLYRLKNIFSQNNSYNFRYAEPEVLTVKINIVLMFNLVYKKKTNLNKNRMK